MIAFTTERGAPDDVTIINEGSSGGITGMLAALTALVLVALASFPLIEAQRGPGDTGLSAPAASAAARAAPAGRDAKAANGN
jgi:hypothetical protein